VLLHELAHVARRDWLSQLAAEALRVAFWFNPLAWVAARQLRSESERACDDVVLAAGVEADEFAGALVALARALRQPRITALPAPAMARPSSLEGRVHAMLNTTLDRRPASRRARVIIAALLFAISLPVASIRAQAFYSLSGRVTDPSNRVLPDATLVLTNQSSGAIYQIKTDAQGQYQFVGLPGSTYSMRVTVMGFETMNVNGLTIGSDTQRDLQLSVGSLEESVTVSASSAPAPPPSADLRATAAERFAARLAKAQAACAADASVGGHLVAPVKLVDAFPIYPDADKAAGIDGTVTMEAVIGEDGFVSDVKNVTGGDALLQRAAEDAVRQWQYSQTLLNCQPTAVHMKVTVNFSAKR
jgi:TonB family protein